MFASHRIAFSQFPCHLLCIHDFLCWRHKSCEDVCKMGYCQSTNILQNTPQSSLYLPSSLTASDVRAASSMYISLLNTRSRIRPVTGDSSRCVRRRRAKITIARPVPPARYHRRFRTHSRISCLRLSGRLTHHFLILLYTEGNYKVPVWLTDSYSKSKVDCLDFGKESKQKKNQQHYSQNCRNADWDESSKESHMHKTSSQPSAMHNSSNFVRALKGKSKILS